MKIVAQLKEKHVTFVMCVWLNMVVNLQALLGYHSKMDVDTSDMKIYKSLARELIVLENDQDENQFTILKWNLLVIHNLLQTLVINLVHEGHQGLLETKQLLRQKMWFLHFSKWVEETCRHCLACLAAVHKKCEELLKMFESSVKVWHSSVRKFLWSISKWDICTSSDG